MDDGGSNENHGASISTKFHYEQMLQNAVIVTEMAMELKERADASEKYVCYLRSLAVRASRAISTMHNSAKNFAVLSRRFTCAALKNLENGSSSTSDVGLQNLRQEYERLVAILDREILDSDDLESVDLSPANDLNGLNASGIAERLRNLETKQRLAEQNCNLPRTPSARSFRSEVSEKYPDSWSKESVISLNNIVNLPSVPEDAFTSFSKPTRTSSLSSLKSIRKVKLFLQRTVTSEDEASECDDHELSVSVSRTLPKVLVLVFDWRLSGHYQDDPTSSSEGGESRSVALSVKKVGGLRNIKEETPQDP